MSPESQRIAIAEACGWRMETKTFRAGCWISPKGATFSRSLLSLPDYLSDLNAMHEAERVLEADGKERDFMFFLREIVGGFAESQSYWCDYDWFRVAHATAAQRAEAFLRTLNLWTE